MYEEKAANPFAQAGKCEAPSRSTVISHIESQAQYLAIATQKADRILDRLRGSEPQCAAKDECAPYALIDLQAVLSGGACRLCEKLAAIEDLIGL